MENDRVSVRLENMNSTLTKMLEKCDIIEKSIVDTKTKLDESKAYFDTPSATFFRTKVDDLLDVEILNLKNDFKTSVEALNKIISLYKKEVDNENAILKDVTGGN